MQVLALTAEPTPWRELFGPCDGGPFTLNDVFAQAFPSANTAMLQAILTDLHARNLVRYPTDRPHPITGPWSPTPMAGPLNPTPSDLGQALLDFIKSPSAEQQLTPASASQQPQRRPT